MVEGTWGRGTSEQAVQSRLRLREVMGHLSLFPCCFFPCIPVDKDMPLVLLWGRNVVVWEVGLCSGLVSGLVSGVGGVT